MSDLDCELESGTILCVIPGPSVELARDPDERDTRWCFACRAHLPHEWVCMGDPPSPLQDFLAWDELDGYSQREVIWSLSPYDPIWRLDCSRCHRDRTYFGAGSL